MRERAVVVDGRVDRQSVLATDVVVVQTVTGRDMNEACARIVGDEVVAGEKFPGAIAERMLVFDRLEMFGI